MSYLTRGAPDNRPLRGLQVTAALTGSAKQGAGMKKSALSIIVLAFLMQLSCSSSKYFTPVSAVRRDPQQQLSEDDIRKAFEAKPQLVKPINIAVYGGGSSIEGFADSLMTIEGVAQVFEISPVLLEGGDYYQRRGHRWYGYYREPVTADIKQLRLLSAQGKADLLVYCAASHVYEEHTNVLGYTFVLLLTALFVPGIDAKLTTDVDILCADVRNGFLYGAYHDQEVYSRNFVSLYYQQNIDGIKDRNISNMVPRLVGFMRELLARKEIYVDSKR